MLVYSLVIGHFTHYIDEKDALHSAHLIRKGNLLIYVLSSSRRNPNSNVEVPLAVVIRDGLILKVDSGHKINGLFESNIGKTE